jgi:multidrug efflux pump subunit AcrB
MWIVRLALRRTYTFVVVALLIAVLGAVSIYRMSTDIFPSIDIPVVSVVWQYTGMPADDVESRIVLLNERILTASVNDIEHIESQSLSGVGVIRKTSSSSSSALSRGRGCRSRGVVNSGRSWSTWTRTPCTISACLPPT